MLLSKGACSKRERFMQFQEQPEFPLTPVIIFKPLPKSCSFWLVEWRHSREEGGNSMLCKQILYLKGNKKSTKTAVKYLHFCRFRQNIKSSCTVKSPVPFLSILSSLPPPVCALLLLLSVWRAAATKRDPLHSYGDRAGDPPGVWDNTHPAEPPAKYICEMFLKNRHKIFGYTIIPFFFF